MDDYAIFPFSELYWEQMQRLVHTIDELKAEGYRMEPFRAEEIEGLKRCRNCYCRSPLRPCTTLVRPKCSMIVGRLRAKKENRKEEDLIILDADQEEEDKRSAGQNDKGQVEETDRTKQEKKPKCRVHPGTVVAKVCFPGLCSTNYYSSTSPAAMASTSTHLGESRTTGTRRECMPPGSWKTTGNCTRPPGRRVAESGEPWRWIAKWGLASRATRN